MSRQGIVAFVLSLSLTLQLVMPLRVIRSSQVDLDKEVSEDIEEIEDDLEKMSLENRFFFCHLILKPLIAAFALLNQPPMFIPLSLPGLQPRPPGGAEGGGGDTDAAGGGDEDTTEGGGADADGDDKEEEKEE